MFRFSPSWTKRQRSGGQTVAETPISSSYSMLGFRQINPEPRPPFKSNSCKTNLCFTLPDFGVQTKGVCTPSLRYAGPLSLTSTLLILDPECASAHQLPDRTWLPEYHSTAACVSLSGAPTVAVH